MTIDVSLLMNFEPVGQLTLEHRSEIAGMSKQYEVAQGLDVLRVVTNTPGRSVYLSRGELLVNYQDGSEESLSVGIAAARHPIVGGRKVAKSAVALSTVEVVLIDSDLIDLMMTWEQAANASQPEFLEDELWAARSKLNKPIDIKLGAIGMFGVNKLQGGAFNRLPSANIDELFRRMQSVQVKAGQVIIKQGEEGDYYYLIESGTAEVTRFSRPDKPPQVLAKLGEGDAFGEEAPVSDNRRNANVTMISDGVLLRLSKQDFIELMKAPLLNTISREEAQKKVLGGAVWLDVRTPSEFDYDRVFPDAINVPLSDIRSEMPHLDKRKVHIVYCQSGRRSSAAAFIMSQLGFEVYMVEVAPVTK
ncbi:MAG: cyclic nucleotide-binding domain-containing protein [Methylophilales bacterium]|nr:cyclic nucleotide-binding domain-containing protein [Methylophilales bacterium]